jgi:cysteinyl-tRNA synthetase
MIKFFNTMTKKKEEFKPLKDKIVTIYNCGLTVYDYAHIGNLRAYTFADILRRQDGSCSKKRKDEPMVLSRVLH